VLDAQLEDAQLGALGPSVEPSVEVWVGASSNQCGGLDSKMFSSTLATSFPFPMHNWVHVKVVASVEALVEALVEPLETALVVMWVVPEGRQWSARLLLRNQCHTLHSNSLTCGCSRNTAIEYFVFLLHRNCKVQLGKITTTAGGEARAATGEGSTTIDM